METDCVEFLRWALPRLGLRWEGYRKVRRQVCRRAGRRASELGLAGLHAYRARLEHDPAEWRVFEGFTRITISRFDRDREVFAVLESRVLPRLAAEAAGAGRNRLEVWSAGCASGEEPYSVALIWHLAIAPRFPKLSIRVLATDVDPAVLERADRACYRGSSLKELPPERLALAFTQVDEEYCLRPEYREGVEVRRHDIRSGVPDGPFDLILCRNLAFTYFEPREQLRVGEQIEIALRPGGALVIGSHEQMPVGIWGLEPWPEARSILRRTQGAGAGV